MPSPPHIANAAQAALLTRPANLPALHALMREPLSVGDLAAQVGGTPRQAYGLVQKLLAADIVRQVGTRPHRGRAVRLFQAWQPWFVPFEATGAATLGEFLHTQMAGRQRRMLSAVAAEMLERSPAWGYWVGMGPKGGRFEFQNASGEPYPTDTSHSIMTQRELRLNDMDSGEFRQRLWALLREFEERSCATPTAAPQALSIVLASGDWWDEGAGDRMP